MGADDVGRGVCGRAGKIGDQVGDPPAGVIVGLFGNREPRRLEGLAQVALGPVKPVAPENGAFADLGAERPDVAAERLDQFGVRRRLPESRRILPDEIFGTDRYNTSGSNA
jgi:hypothetical protein